ncbi:MAG: 30S ribosomal protein S20 [Alphaproteobacteria bacterium]|jgi:small subunit ribosomal protein S20|nr:30S ribosomal protein S20 [Alphaproteobacteria bacterium]MBT4016762.1 30S ribosomal protein S20 [Alphaproteobacteria bacterium]MBT5158740.1 30S ribosomal protein S20 [Alphaproteobacteria bacterium]MBT5917954.1 30S ribosomal protein S20 [Alphaproteobacteria bacterium]MBT6386829.1 30S ribosomal protein S20 [Alphaproteobacteria bacterium]
MAHHKSSLKRIRRTERATAVNRDRRGRIRTEIRNVEEAIAAGDQTAAQVALKQAQPEIMRGVTRGILKQNTASRKVSRMAHRIKGMAG